MAAEFLRHQIVSRAAGQFSSCRIPAASAHFKGYRISVASENELPKLKKQIKMLIDSINTGP